MQYEYSVLHVENLSAHLIPGRAFFLPDQDLGKYEHQTADEVSRVPDQNGVSLLYIEGSRPEWCISTI